MLQKELGNVAELGSTTAPSQAEIETKSELADNDSERFFCPFPSCNRSFAELWRLKVHFRAPPDVRGSGRERGHGTELAFCPRCDKALKPGKHHVGCIAGKSLSKPTSKRRKKGDTSKDDEQPVEEVTGIQQGGMVAFQGQQQQMQMAGSSKGTGWSGLDPHHTPGFPNCMPFQQMPWHDASYVPAQHSHLTMPVQHPHVSLQVPHPHLSLQIQHPHVSLPVQHPQLSLLGLQAHASLQVQHPQMMAMGHYQHANFMGQHTQQHLQPSAAFQMVPACLPPAAVPAPVLPMEQPGPSAPLADLSRVFDDDDFAAPSPPPLPEDFSVPAPDAVSSSGNHAAGMLFNFGQFSRCMPRCQPALAGSNQLVKDLTQEALDLAESNVVYETHDDGDLMQLLFGVADEMPTMATIHLHKYVSGTHDAEDEAVGSSEATPLSSTQAAMLGGASLSGAAGHSHNMGQQQQNHQQQQEQQQEELCSREAWQQQQQQAAPTGHDQAPNGGGSIENYIKQEESQWLTPDFSALAAAMGHDAALSFVSGG